MTGRLRTVLHGLFVPDRTMLIDDERFTLDELVILRAQPTTEREERT